MGIFSLFSKKSSPDYETLLAQLSTDINEAKIHLSEIRLRERRFGLLVNAYGIALWAVWVGLWYVGGIPWGLVGLSAHDVEARAVGVGGIMGGPVFIWLLNRLLHFIFARQRNSEETHLRLLLSKQRTKLDEIKKATNYDSTRKLIERYDEGTGQMGPSVPVTPTRRGQGNGGVGTPGSNGKMGTPMQGGTPRAPGHLVGAGGTPGPQAPGTPVSIPPGMAPEQAAALQMQLQMQAIQPVLPTPEKRWYDRVVDSILGDDPSQAAQNKYALVCGECFRHNGLVGSQHEWERMQWICPRCNHMNPSPLSRAKDSPSEQPVRAPIASAATAVPPPASPAAHVQRSTASPRPRRQLTDKGTPRSSRLGKEVFNASEEEEEEIDDSHQMMDVDEDK